MSAPEGFAPHHNATRERARLAALALSRGDGQALKALLSDAAPAPANECLRNGGHISECEDAEHCANCGAGTVLPPVPRGSENGNRYSPTGTSMWTATRRNIELTDLRSAPFCIEDISHHLDGTIRFGGGNPTKPTVAQHSLAVEYIVDKLIAEVYYAGSMTMLRKVALMHDAAEAYIGDLTGAVKKMLRNIEGNNQSAFDRLEGAVETAIFEHYGITSSREIDELVHEADCLACAYEMQREGWHATDCPEWLRVDHMMARCYQAGAAFRFRQVARSLGMVD